MALGSGSDSARVNEVAKLCRAVVPVMEGKVRSEGGPAGIGEELVPDGWMDLGSAEDKSCRLVHSTKRPIVGSAIQESPFITVCDGLDQAFKGIWWMPWH